MGNIACTGDALQVFQLLQTYTLLTGHLISNVDVTGQAAAKISDCIKNNLSNRRFQYIYHACFIWITSLLTTSLENHVLAGSTAPEEMYERIADDLYQRGYSIIPAALPPALTTRLTAYAHEAIDFDPAGIGRAGQYHQNEFVRTDEICWIQGTAAVTTAWLNWMDCLKAYLNKRLFLGLFSYESHFAHYPPGSFYKRHMDAFQGESNRVLSTVFYLNSDWTQDDGGELVISPPATPDEAVSVTPLAGTMVIFLSEEFPHEVLPARRNRFSIAGWFRVNNSTAQRVDPPR